jgi:SAM-dependent methyltransferase
MLDTLRPITAAPVPCKICGGASLLFGVVDFHKSCEEPNGLRLSLSGVPVYYRRCANCRFVFTDAFDDWSPDQFKTHIYNDDYGMVDPDYKTERPRSNAEVVAQLWGEHRKNTRVLDFGGGNGALCTALRENGFPVAEAFDPMVPEFARRPVGKFDLVTSFETFEHLPDPMAGIASILESAADPGAVLFTTLLQPADFDNHGVNWWYIGPRNGHVSIFSKQALSIAWSRHRYQVASLNDLIHLAFRNLPPYLTHLQKK